MRYSTWVEITTAIAAMTGGIARAGEVAPAVDRKVMVCMQYGFDVQALYPAQQLTSRMFAGIGIEIEWPRWPHSCPDGDTIVITLSYGTPKDQLPDAWAYALPYEGTHIVVFYDRIRQKVPPARVPTLLAHVMAHEITHILECVKRHSESGIMKAQWDNVDLFEMGRRPLVFAQEDIDLIYVGLGARKSRAAQIPVATVR